MSGHSSGADLGKILKFILEFGEKMKKLFYLTIGLAVTELRRDNSVAVVVNIL